MKKILFFSSNINKVKEIKNIFKKNKLNILSLNDFANLKNPLENGKTFVENAKIKSSYGFEKTKIPCFSDDSGMINYINFAFIQPDGSWISSDYECAIGANTDVNNGTYSCDMNTSAITGVPLAMMRIRVVDMSDNWTTLDIPDALTIVYNP